MKKQNREQTSIVRALTELSTNSREENDQNVHSFGTSLRSDNTQLAQIIS